MSTEKKYFIETYGCEMNKSDSIDISLSMQDSGFLPAAGPDDADVVIINTCAVRENAEQRVMGRLGRYRSSGRGGKSPQLIVLAGCMAQERGEEIAKLFPEVGVVAGTYHTLDIPAYVRRFAEERAGQVALDRESYEFSPYRGERAEAHRAWVTIMKGCSNFCSYCIVPHLRGPEKSKPIGSVVREVEELASRGVVEITLLGQNVNAYGADSGDPPFIELLEAVHRVEGIRWIRFLTSHPKDFTENVIRRMSSLPKLCRHVHLPLQSGSDRLLELMNRKYSFARYLELAGAVREYMPTASLTTDLIVGFPTESRDDFSRTLDAVEAVRFDEAFTYRYSERPFTSAAGIGGKVPAAEAAARLTELIALQRSVTMEKNREQIGTRQTALVERPSRKNPAEQLCRTGSARMVVVKTGAAPGSFIRVDITGMSGGTLRGVEHGNTGQNP
jgi:tRNA-2-methylthio-N6-dimethylallyladenosine synthase